MRHTSKTILGATDVTTTGVTQVTASFDTLGFSYATIQVFAATSAGPSSAVSNHVLQESDASGSGFATISGSGFSTIASTTLSTALAKVIYNVDLRGRKRYLKVTYSSNAATQPFVTCDLTSASDGIVTAAEAGAGHIVTI
jgi:ABC-type Fe3+ transport system permease subunit